MRQSTSSRFLFRTVQFVLVLPLLWPCYGLTSESVVAASISIIRSSKVALNRRQAFHQFVSATKMTATITAVMVLGLPFPSVASEGELSISASSPASTSDSANRIFDYENRNRNSNKSALIRDDYYYMSGKAPPRLIDMENLKGFNDPKWNTWGTCTSSSSNSSNGGNSCTYVSLKQRIPGYSKYAFNIQLGTKEYQQLGKALLVNNKSNNAEASSLLSDTAIGTPSPATDALLKGVLLATSLLTSPNYSGPPLELLVARFYLNEASFATNEIRVAILVEDRERAVAAWNFGRDSWNSYLSIVNRAIVPKVGDKFEAIA